ncbi:20429_t:CDS:2 [Funneliformis geosporum]|uniref:9661_t:CDS:1 n=1 Tax=Funneliformis geosporum TaxID=1117311 RepID=A0A9W4WZ72_9GLOM|nr:20429_t:CDS:2 [Funneliformis geosporum]CAI2183343.1 9661_t:CDS:2 [Funneliformis geosporum]
MNGRIPITRFSILAERITLSRVTPLARRNFATATGVVSEDFSVKRKHVEEHARKTFKLWKKISLSVVPISVFLSVGNAVMIMNEHAAHNLEHPHVEEPFFWGDGNHTLFHNTAVNGP